MTHFPVLRPWRMPLLPAIGALLGAFLALTPSLLPRADLHQGLLCAVAAALGYGLGSSARWIARGAGLKVSERLRGRVRRAFAILALVSTAVMLWLSRLWQGQQRADIGMDGILSPLGVLSVLLVAAAVFALLLVIARSLRGAGRWLMVRIDRVLPPAVAAVLATLLVVWGANTLIRDIAVGRVAAALDASFLSVNDDFIEVAQPTAFELSAGPGSAVTWESLGRQGRIFIANAPSREQIVEFWSAGISQEIDEGSPLQPIRVYVGGGTDAQLDLRAQADTVVAELERTGGFDRAVLNVVTGTGRGWVNENQARALELMWGGDTATASMQYSYLPSWMSYLIDGDRPREAGRVLFEAVYERWLEAPEQQRPLLVVSGESLGSFGSEGAFSGAQDLATRTDGALYVGPTANNQLWAQFTADRDGGSPIHLPVYRSGETIRFSADGRSWQGDGVWSGSRIGYLQHANDPVTWLDFGEVFSKPEWLKGERGPGVPAAMIWVPVVTTLQLAVDQLASGVPDGQGHEFGQAPAYAWSAILPPDGWSETDTDRLAEELVRLRALDLDHSSSS